MQLFFAPAIGPVVSSIPRECRRATQLLLGYVGSIASEVGIVRELVPWHGMFFGTHPEKASERHHGVSDFSADLLDHEPLNASDTRALGVVDFSALYPVAFDERLAGHSSGA